MLLRKLTVIVIVSILIVSPVPLARADLSGSMRDMFDRWGFRVTATQPGAYEAQTRGFGVGGSITARAPFEHLQLFTLKSPDIKAGCGGIDIFGGAFSFINAEQFVQFLKAIGQNALGYAFSLGLEAVCPTCNSALQWLRNQMNEINKHGMDSCAAAKSLVHAAGHAAGMWDMQACIQREGQGDHVRGWLRCGVGGEAEVRKQLRDTRQKQADEATAKGKKDVPIGSTVPQALQWSGLTVDQKQYIMSVVGTWSTVQKEGNVPSDCKFHPGTLTLRDLVLGGKVKLLTCGSGREGLKDGKICQDIKEEDVVIDGFAKLVRDKMNKILDKYKANTPLTPDEVAFVNSIPIPPVAHMLKSSLAYSETLSRLLIDITSEAAATMLAWQLIESYTKIYEARISNISVCPQYRPNVIPHLRQVRENKHELFDKYLKIFKAQVDYLQLAASIDLRVAALVTERLERAIQYRPSS